MADKPVTRELPDLIKRLKEKDAERAAYILEDVVPLIPKPPDVLAALPEPWSSKVRASAAPRPAARILTAEEADRELKRRTAELRARQHHGRSPGAPGAAQEISTTSAVGPPPSLEQGAPASHGGEDVVVVQVLEHTDEVLVRTARGEVRYVPRGELAARS
jgi:hypothetical protein